MSGETLDRPVGRRTVLGGAALVAAGAGVSACASGATTDTQASSTAKATAIGGAAAAARTTAAAAGGVGKDTDVPVGGGKIFNGAVVVTQPAAGTFKAFNATCTHQGCTVSEVTASGISCPCHGSVFSINDGSVVQGPATKPLTVMKVTADNGTLVVS
jgi:Rieske Fe-S protein